MPRHVKHMNALAVRKQLLIAESELNRIQLAAANAGIHSRLCIVPLGSTTVGAIASSAAMLAVNLAAIPRKKQTAGTTSWCLQTVLYGAVLISSVWLMLLPCKPRTHSA